MRLLILIFSLWALAYAKPEMYKEKEDFQFSRSSSDDGTKSGFYGAQRGNMGGNYERAHNMDALAQHQMSTLVRHVDGELGEGANTRTGSVYTAGNSRGIYGSGNFDLSNLKGRNFEEGLSYGDSQSSFSSQSSRYSGSSYSAADNARYSASQLRALGLNSAYLQTGLASQYGQQIDNQQAENQYSGTSNYEYGSQGGSNYRYYTHGGSQARSEYDQSNANLHTLKNYDDSSKSKLITTPVRFYIRPGTRITIPVSAQTYDASQSALVSDQSTVKTESEILSNSGQRINVIRPGTRITIPVAAQTYDASQNALVRDQNTVNSEAEILSNSGQRINVIKPVSNAKHYEHSYSYRKEWEKHDSQPITVMPTENPFPKNSELYEESQLSQVDGQQQLSEVDSANVQSSNINNAYSSQVNSGYSSGYSANTKSAAASRLQYQSQQQSSGANTASNAYTYDTHNAGATSNLNSLVENINSRPKSYQSSYSYHKSWERRGDPYVIQPAGSDISGQTSQRLSAATTDQNLYYGNQYGQNICDLQCHLRKRRSYNMEQYEPHMYQEQFSQQPNKWENLDYLGQQTQNKWDNLEDLGQQTQNQWSNLGDLGQQTQNKWENFENLNQHPHSYSEELGQQSQNHFDNLEDLGQQTQNTWNNLESLNQHTQGGIEEIGQQSQSQLNNLEDLGQQTQNTWDNLESLNQHTQSGVEEVGQQSQSQLNNLEDLGQQTQNTWDNLESLNQHTQGGIEEIGQQSQSQLNNLEDLGQQTQNTWNNLESLNQHTQSDIEEIGQQSQSQLNKLEDLGQQTQNTWDNLESLNQHSQSNIEETDQQSQTQLDNLENLGQQTQNQWDQLEGLGQQTQNKWEKFDNTGQQTQTKWNNEQMTPQTQNNEQETFNTWNGLELTNNENQQSRKQEEQTHRYKVENLDNQNKHSEDNMDQTMFHYMQPGHNIWNKINNFESQQNSESYNEHSSNQHTSFHQNNNFMHREQSQNDWKEFRGAFNQENLDPWGNMFHDHYPNQATDEKTPMTSNSEKSLWDAIDKMISESDKKTDNVNNEQYLGPHTSNEKLEENQSANSNHDNSFNFYKNPDSEEPKEIVTEKSLLQSPEPHKNLEIDSIDKTVTISTTEKIRTTEKPKNTITSHQINSPHDIGRGDIGPEEIPPVSLETKDQNNNTKAEEDQKTFNSNKLYKTQDEIESLSSTHVNEDKLYQEPINDELLNVVGLDKQVEITSTSTKKPRVNNYNSHTDFITHYDHHKQYNIPSYNNPSAFEIKPNYADSQNTEVQIPENVEQQNFEQTLADLEQQMGLDQQVEMTSTSTKKPRVNYYNSHTDFITHYDHHKQYNIPSFTNPSAFETKPNYPDSQNTEVQIPENIDQQNFEQTLVDLEQQMSNMQDLTDFGQEVQVPINENVQREFHSQQHLGYFNKDLQGDHEKVQKQVFFDIQNKDPLNENEKIYPVSNNFQTVHKNEDAVVEPIEPTEKPGFWGSVWKKTVSAKDKVVSWFKN